MAAAVLHRVSWSCPNEGGRQEWFTTWNKAMAFARRERISDGATFDQVEVPRTKLELCDWLNRHARTATGEA
jgi:hypothetical protein